jgi:potassium-transporting ATPase KdpC subunit
MNMVKSLKTGVVLFGLFAVLTGLAYPMLITLAGQGLFPHQANGSLITVDGKVVGSELIGQQFDDLKYFWGRPSATASNPYNAASSGGSNLAPTNPQFVDQVEKRIQVLRSADPGNKAPIPVDLVTSSASGLDPDISPAAAYYQAGRVARVRGLDVKLVQQYISNHTQPRILGFIGEPRVNVLELNLALDHLQDK